YFMNANKLSKEKAAVPNISIDSKDREILKMLQQNGRVTVKEIAAAVHLSTTPVHERVKRLEQSGIIAHYTAILDAAKLGKKLMVICHVSLREHNKIAGSKFIKAIMDMPEILECYSISGEFDFLLKVLTTDMEDRKSTRLNSSHVKISYAVFCLKKKTE